MLGIFQYIVSTFMVKVIKLIFMFGCQQMCTSMNLKETLFRRIQNGMMCIICYLIIWIDSTLISRYLTYSTLIRHQKDFTSNLYSSNYLKLRKYDFISEVKDVIVNCKLNDNAFSCSVSLSLHFLICSLFLSRFVNIDFSIS